MVQYLLFRVMKFLRNKGQPYFSGKVWNWVLNSTEPYNIIQGHQKSPTENQWKSGGAPLTFPFILSLNMAPSKTMGFHPIVMASKTKDCQSKQMHKQNHSFRMQKQNRCSDCRPVALSPSGATSKEWPFFKTASCSYGPLPVLNGYKWL